MQPGMQPGTTTVTIYGQEYTVRSDGDAEYVRRIASYLDARMREVAKQSNQVTSLRVAILAALNITDELFRVREIGSGEAETLRARADDLATRLEAIVLDREWGGGAATGDVHGVPPDPATSTGASAPLADAGSQDHDRK
jgi:cell division protein ZapA